jgi:hypothetical protein
MTWKKNILYCQTTRKQRMSLKNHACMCVCTVHIILVDEDELERSEFSELVEVEVICGIRNFRRAHKIKAYGLAWVRSFVEL